MSEKFYLAPSGVDSPSCGLSPLTACASLNQTLHRLTDLSLPSVTVVLLAGVFSGAGNRNLNWPSLSGVTIKSESGYPEDVVIDLDHRGRLFTFTDSPPMTMQGITIRNGAGIDTTAGAIMIKGSSPNFAHVIFEDMYLDGYSYGSRGGALIITGASTSDFYNVTFRNCTSGIAGGVYINHGTPAHQPSGVFASQSHHRKPS
jgi:hypothetical protein